MNKIKVSVIILSINVIMLFFLNNIIAQDKIKCIKIGKAIWMVENLNVDHFRNGDTILEARTNEEWSKACLEKRPVWCYFYNNIQNGKKYGRLYNGYAVNDPRGLAPKGWRIPEISELQELSASVNNDANAIKVKGEGSGDGIGTNSSGFSAYPVGFRLGYSLHKDDNHFLYSGIYANYWSCTQLGSDELYFTFIRINDSYFNFGPTAKDYGFSVRCIKE